MSGWVAVARSPADWFPPMHPSDTPCRILPVGYTTQLTHQFIPRSSEVSARPPRIEAAPCRADAVAAGPKYCAAVDDIWCAEQGVGGLAPLWSEASAKRTEVLAILVAELQGVLQS